MANKLIWSKTAEKNNLGAIDGFLLRLGMSLFTVRA
jgi:hypothetical protein